MAAIHPGMTLVAACLLPLIAIVTRVFGSRIHVLFDRVQEQFSTLSSKVQEVIGKDADSPDQLLEGIRGVLRSKPTVPPSSEP